MGARKLYTDEERERKKKENYLLRQKPKEEADYKRLAPIRIDDYKKLNKKESKQFKTEIKAVSRKRFDEIFNDNQMWEKINTTSDVWLVKKERQERKKRSGGGKWITNDEIQKAERVIWGGYNEEIFEEDTPTEYENPYGELPE